MSAPRRNIMWLRRYLRIGDNPALLTAIETKKEVIYQGEINGVKCKGKLDLVKPNQMVIDLKQKGYPNEIIEKMMKKMGVQKNALNATVKLTDDEIADMLKNLGGSFDRESVKKALTEFSKQRGLKLNSKQIEQVADDVVIELGKMNPKFRPEEFERIWTTKMTTKDKENLIQFCIGNDKLDFIKYILKKKININLYLMPLFM